MGLRGKQECEEVIFDNSPAVPVPEKFNLSVQLHDGSDKAQEGTRIWSFRVTLAAAGINLTQRRGRTRIGVHPKLDSYTQGNL